MCGNKCTKITQKELQPCSVLLVRQRINGSGGDNCSVDEKYASFHPKHGKRKIDRPQLMLINILLV